MNTNDSISANAQADRFRQAVEPLRRFPYLIEGVLQRACLEHPQDLARLHREYLRADEHDHGLSTAPRFPGALVR